MTDPCCNWDHVRDCGKIPGVPDGEPICACGCSGYDERCGSYTSTHPDDIIALFVRSQYEDPVLAAKDLHPSRDSVRPSISEMQRKLLDPNRGFPQKGVYS